MAQVVAGLDIGTTKIACIIAEYDEDSKMKVLGVGISPIYEGLRKGVVVNIDRVVQTIRKAVTEAETMAGIDITEVYVGVAGEHIRTFNTSGVVAVNSETGITQEDIDRAQEAAEAIPVLKDLHLLHNIARDFKVDDQEGIKDPIGMSGVRLEINALIVTAPKSSITDIEKCVTQAGFVVKELVLEPYASRFAVLENDEEEVGVVLVDLGGGTTDLSIYVNGALKQTAVLGIGSEYITSDIAMGLRTPVPQAEIIKVTYGCADARQVKTDESFIIPGVAGREDREGSRPVLTTIIAPRLEEILQLANREIDRPSIKGLLGAGVVLTGGGSQLEGVKEVAERVFKLPVKLGKPVGFSSAVESTSSPAHATGIGLCLFALEKEALLDGEESATYSDGFSSFFSKILLFLKNHI